MGVVAQSKVPDGFTFVKAGTFMMGSPESDKDREEGEYYHQVTITNDFYIRKTEVTQEDSFSVTGKSYRDDKEDGLYPVEQVSWYTAIIDCNKRSLKEGLTPCYHIDHEVIDANSEELNEIWDNGYSKNKVKWTVTCNWNANG